MGLLSVLRRNEAPVSSDTEAHLTAARAKIADLERDRDEVSARYDALRAPMVESEGLAAELAQLKGQRKEAQVAQLLAEGGADTAALDARVQKIERRLEELREPADATATALKRLHERSIALSNRIAAEKSGLKPLIVAVLSERLTAQAQAFRHAQEAYVEAHVQVASLARAIDKLDAIGSSGCRSGDMDLIEFPRPAAPAFSSVAVVRLLRREIEEEARGLLADLGA